MKKCWAIALCSVALISGGYYLTTKTNKSHSTFPTLTVGYGNVLKQAMAVGQIIPAHSVSVKSQIDGIVGEIYHVVGEQVTLGTPLVKVRPNPTPHQLTNATSILKQSEAHLESLNQMLVNWQHLVEQKIIPQNYSELIKIKSEVKSNQALVQQRKQDLELIRSGEALIGNSKLTSILVAPINGTIIDLKVAVGEPIMSTTSSKITTEMVLLADMNNMIFKGSVSEHDAADLAVGMPASLTLATYPEAKITGVLSKVAVQSDYLNNPKQAKTNNFDNGFAVEINNIRFPDTITIRSGFSATAKITLKHLENVIIIPERALRFKADQPEVLIPDQSEQGYQVRSVKLSLSDGINVEVIDGLSVGDVIIDNSLLGVMHDHSVSFSA